MPKYKISQYKTYTLDYIVEAENEVDALTKHAKCQSKPDLDSLVFLDEPIDIGLGLDCLSEDVEITDEQMELIVDKKADFLPGIHHIEKVDE